MSNRLLALRLAVVCGAVLSEGIAHAQPARQWETLRGLPGVEVVVEPLPRDLEREGLLRSQVQTEVERRLRIAGLGVLTPEERRNTPGRAFLYVNVNATRGDRGVYSYAILVSVTQRVALERDPSVRVLAITWLTGGVGISRVAQLRESVAAHVGEFITAYAAANPKGTRRSQ